MTSLAGPESRLRRTVQSIPLVGPALRALAILYHRGRAEIEGSYRDVKERRLPAARDSAAVAGGAALSRGARRLLHVPYRNEHVDLPLPLTAGKHRFDVVEDLVEFTGLSSESVRALIARQVEDFRTEWLQWPESLRDDRWFYLSSRMYLFANAAHFYEAPEVIDEVVGLLSPDARVLEFGGGTGNLSLALAARGFRVDYHELSALQKDFTRFRTQRHGLQEHVGILDGWSSLPAQHYDAICAFDVFEHLPDLPQVVQQLASALVDGGLLIDTPSFSVGLANPMHHEDPGLASLLDEQGLALDRTLTDFRIWKKR